MEQLQCNVTHFHVRETKIGSYLVAGNPFAASWTFSKGPCCDDDAESIDTASMASAVTSGASGFLLGDDAAEFMRQRGEQT